MIPFQFPKMVHHGYMRKNNLAFEGITQGLHSRQ